MPSPVMVAPAYLRLRRIYAQKTQGNPHIR
jgi:hypothetical protein